MPDRGDSPLHTSLRSRCTLETLRELLDSSSWLVNAKNNVGQTPLMIAALTGNAAAARLLLDYGAKSTINARSNGRLRSSAADYAREHGLTCLADELDTIAQRQVELCSAGDHSMSYRVPSECIDRCCLCGDRMGAVSKFHVAAREAARGSTKGGGGAPPCRLITNFFHHPSVTDEVIDALSLPALHRINRTNKFTRELTESLAILEALRRVIGAQGEGGEGAGAAEGEGEGGGGDGGGGSDGANHQAWHVIDLCCGKSHTTAILSRLYPHWKITAVDRIPASRLPHVCNDDAMPGLEFRIRTAAPRHCTHDSCL